MENVADKAGSWQRVFVGGDVEEATIVIAGIGAFKNEKYLGSVALVLEKDYNSDSVRYMVRVKGDDKMNENYHDTFNEALSEYHSCVKSVLVLADNFANISNVGNVTFAGENMELCRE